MARCDCSRSVVTRCPSARARQGSPQGAERSRRSNEALARSRGRAWIQTMLSASAVIPWNPKRQKQQDRLPQTWTAEELRKRTSIERFFARVLVFFCLRRPPVLGWLAVETPVVPTDAAGWVDALGDWP